MGDVELDWLCQVVARHCPAFFIHPSGRAAVCRARTILAVLYSFEVFEPEPRRLLAVCADRYMPCSAEWFMDHSELRQTAADAGVASSKVLLARGSVAGPLLLEAQRHQAQPGTRLWLHLDPAARTGMPQASHAAPGGCAVVTCACMHRQLTPPAPCLPT